MKPICTSGFILRSMIGIEDAVGDGPVVDRLAGRVLGVGVGGAPLERGLAVAGHQQAVDAHVDRHGAERRDFGQQLLAVLHVGVVRLIVAEEGPDRLQRFVGLPRGRPGSEQVPGAARRYPSKSAGIRRMVKRLASRLPAFARRGGGGGDPPDAVSSWCGAAKLGVFGRLNASARNCNWRRSAIWNCLNSERSTCAECPARIRSRSCHNVKWWEREGRRVEPLGERRVVQLAGTDAVGSLSADTGVGHIARHRRSERHAAAEQHDSLQLPPADHAVGQRVRTGSNALPLPNGSSYPKLAEKL